MIDDEVASHAVAVEQDRTFRISTLRFRQEKGDVIHQIFIFRYEAAPALRPAMPAEIDGQKSMTGTIQLSGEV